MFCFKHRSYTTDTSVSGPGIQTLQNQIHYSTYFTLLLGFFGWLVFILVFVWIAYDADALMLSSRFLEVCEYCRWQTLWCKSIKFCFFGIVLPTFRYMCEVRFQTAKRLTFEPLNLPEMSTAILRNHFM